MNTGRISVLESLKQIDRFFQGQDAVHKTLRRTANRLEGSRIPYAVIGGMAVNLHGYRHTTGDVDILLTSDGLEAFRNCFVPEDYEADARRMRRFLDRRTATPVDVALKGSFAGPDKVRGLSYPDPCSVRVRIDDLWVADLTALIQIKLAIGRYCDLGDVAGLIRSNRLDATLAERLHPWLRREYVNCLAENGREDEYEARQG
jgi:hypothetical protein